MAKLALLIGVSEYESDLEPLPGSLKDIQAMQRVLQHPEMGGFEITILPNPQRQQMEEAIEHLFSNRDREDLVLLYFSGHGITDDRGRLYLTNRQTRKNDQSELVKTTAVAASLIHEVMENSYSRRQVIILDSCFSGAFAEGMKAKDSGIVDIKNQLGGEGRVVLTSSTATQYSFARESEELSVYTRYIVEGIETGAADTDNDGMISVDELHEFAKKKVREAAPAMKPEIYAVKEGFKIYLAKAPVGDPKIEYRKEVEKCLREGKLSPIGKRILKRRQGELKLSDEEVQKIENEVLEPYRKYQDNLQEYEEALKEALEDEKILSEHTREELKRFQQILQLRDEDINDIETRLLQKAQIYDQSTATQSKILGNSNNQQECTDNLKENAILQPKEELVNLLNSNDLPIEINSREIELAEQRKFPKSSVLFECLTDSAKNVIAIAKEETKRLGHNFVGSEQMLLGLIQESDGFAAEILKYQGIKLEDARIEVEEIIGRGSGFNTRTYGFTPRAKRVLELSLEAATELGNNYISTGHILLGIIKEGDGAAITVLNRFGVDLQDLKNQVNRTIKLSIKSSNFNQDNDLSSEKGIDYSRLRDLLAAGNWKEADEETYLVMILAVGKKDGDWFTDDELLNFPCTDLRTIDRLWVKYSDGKFGFSVQKEIYLSLGGKLGEKHYEEIWEKYFYQVGWKVGESYILYMEATFNISAPKGHLPLLGGGGLEMIEDEAWLVVGWSLSLLSHRDL